MSEAGKEHDGVVEAEEGSLEDGGHFADAFQLAPLPRGQRQLLVRTRMGPGALSGIRGPALLNAL